MRQKGVGRECAWVLALFGGSTYPKLMVGGLVATNWPCGAGLLIAVPCRAMPCRAGGKSYKNSGPGHMLEDIANLKKNQA